MAGIDQFRGALLGGACGDALGYPSAVFPSVVSSAASGPSGRTLVRDAKNGKLAPVSDNTQMVLATIDGILWADAKKLEILEGVYRGLHALVLQPTGEEPRRGREDMDAPPAARKRILPRPRKIHARPPQSGGRSALRLKRRPRLDEAQGE